MSDIATPTTASLRSLIERDGFVVAPGAYDMISARIIKQAGFSAIYLTGNGQSASTLGLPDLGYLTLSEMAERARQSYACTGLPLIVDADTGYGSVLTLQRAVREFEAAGASGIQIEDQLLPKKCGHEPGREVVSVQDMMSRLRAASEARRNPETMIIARTDARSVHGLEEAIRRANAYAEVADVLFVESPESEEELEVIAGSIAKPTFVNMVETGLTPYLPSSRLKELGFSIAIYPATAFLSASAAVQRAMAELHESGLAQESLKSMLSLSEYHDILDFSGLAALEHKFLYQ